jgi:glycosyltransferase involved in cell wall biosynthesis
MIPKWRLPKWPPWQHFGEAQFNLEFGRTEAEKQVETGSSDLAQYFTSSDGTAFKLQRGDPVAVCTYGLGPGGAERQWVYLARNLQSVGYSVTFVTFCPLVGHDAHYAPLLAQYNIPLFDASKLTQSEILHSMTTIPHMESLIKATGVGWAEPLINLCAAFGRLKPKAIFLQLDDPNILGGIAARFCKVPRIVIGFRSQNPTRIDWINRDWFLEGYRLLARSGAVRFVANSQYGGHDYADWIGIPRERVHVIPNTIDPDQFTKPSCSELEELRGSLGIKAGVPILLGVFRLAPEKDPTTFIDVASRTARAVPELKILHCGSETINTPSLRVQLEKRINELGLGASIHFLGQRTDVNALLSLADVVLFTSRLESMSNIILEAQFMGKPVVATSIPGIIENVRDGESAVLCPVGDVERLSEACIALLSNKARAVAMGATGRRFVSESRLNMGSATRYVEVLHSDI